MTQKAAQFRHVGAETWKASFAMISDVPCTPEEHLERMKALGKQITEHIKFMCGRNTLNGCSAEAKEKALEGFYERMLVVERDLGRIREEFQLE